MGKRSIRSKLNGRRDSKSAAPKQPLPVTLLSGFLGAGKTTLLQHILASDHGLKIAIVVNDIGAVNVDASLIQKTHRVTKTQEKVIAMQNGCICCTLRGDLLEELVNLSKLQQFDYVIIESSGISEPEQVAETFDVRLAEQMNVQAMTGDLDEGMVKTLEQIKKAGGLEKFAKLDTTVTVIDAFTMLNDFETADLISARREDVTEEDERTVADLMVDQIEFANVIVLNKTDMVNEIQKKGLRQLIMKLNPGARIIEACRGKVDPKQIVNTKLFNLDEARLGYGWLRDLHEMTAREVNGRKVITPKPETEEYNVRNFVYARGRPFHPDRLWKLVRDTFILQLEHFDDEDEDEEMGDEQEDEDMVIVGSDSGASDSAMSGTNPDTEGSRKASVSTAATAASSTEDMPKQDTDEDYEVPENEVILANRRAHPVFKDLLRSKGGFWLATRPDRRGAWSQAGAMLTMEGDAPFFCTMDPEDYKNEDGQVNELVQHDIEKGGEWGDRRQELVFIGLSLNRDKLASLLDQCLLNDKEWSDWQNVMRDTNLDEDGKIDQLNELFDDGFPDWSEEDGHDHDHDHDDEDHDHGNRQVRSISAYKQQLDEVS